MKVRKTLWKLHSWLGLIAGLGLLIIGVTGSALVFRTEIENWLHPKRAVPDRPGPRLSYDTLLARARAQLPGQEIVGWDTILHQGAADGIAVVHLTNTREWRWLEINPASGELYPEKTPTRSEAIFGWLLDLHYSLLMGDLGVVIAGLLAVLLCLLGISGVWLYRGFWKHFLTLRWGRSARIFCSDLHKMVGISSVGFNLILGLTGAVWNLPTLRNLFDSPDSKIQKTATLYNTQLSFDALVAEATRRMPGLDPTKVYLSLPPRNPTIELHGSVVPRGRFIDEYNSHIEFDAESGKVLRLDDFRTASWWTKFEATFTALHYGTFGGWIVKLLWCILALAPGVLAVSGFLIWHRRRRAGAARRG